jgi:hypothetical protein
MIFFTLLLLGAVFHHAARFKNPAWSCLCLSHPPSFSTFLHIIITFVVAELANIYIL